MLSQQSIELGNSADFAKLPENTQLLPNNWFSKLNLLAFSINLYLRTYVFERQKNYYVDVNIFDLRSHNNNITEQSSFQFSK